MVCRLHKAELTASFDRPRHPASPQATVANAIKMTSSIDELHAYHTILELAPFTDDRVLSALRALAGI